MIEGSRVLHRDGPMIEVPAKMFTIFLAARCSHATIASDAPATVRKVVVKVAVE